MVKQRVLFLGSGRLGNQLFQWVALNRYFPEAEIIAPSMCALATVIETGQRLKMESDSYFFRRAIRSKHWRRWLRRAYKGLKLGGYGFEPDIQLDYCRKLPSGVLEISRPESSTVFVNGGYFQNLRNFLDTKDFQCLRLHDALLARARAAIRATIGSGPWPQFAMHVRRTDYLQFEIYGLSDVVLPAEYFLRAAKYIRDRFAFPGPALVVTDDPEWCAATLAEIGPYYVLHESEQIDFAALTMFPCLVISNSSFSLAAACMATQVEHVIAPKYWFGHRVGKWYPPYIESTDPRFIYL